MGVRKWLPPVATTVFLLFLLSAMIGPVRRIEREETQTKAVQRAETKHTAGTENEEEKENVLQTMIDAAPSEFKITENITVDQAFYLPKDKTLMIAAGVTMTVDAEAASIVEGVFINDGALIVRSEMNFFEDIAGKGSVSVETGGFLIRVIKNIETDGILDEIDLMFSGKSPIKNVVLAPNDTATIRIDRDFTIPRGCGLWTGLYATVEITKGVDFTVEGTFEPYINAITATGETVPSQSNPWQK